CWLPMPAPPAIIFCDSAELAVDLKIALQRICFEAEVRLVDDAAKTFVSAACDDPWALVTTEEIEPAQLVAAVEAHKAPRVIYSLVANDEARALAHELGISSVATIAELICALRLLCAHIDKPWAVNTRKLGKGDRLRLGSLLSQRPD